MFFKGMALPTTALDVIRSGPFTLSLHREIGRGAYAHVYTCTLESSHSGPDRTVYACKRIPLIPETERCFLEASIMACLDHPFIAKAHVVFFHNNALYIVQDLAIDGDLSARSLSRVRTASIPNERKKAWSRALCQAVACLHCEGILHGDIKIENILQYANGVIRLSDFSLAVKRWSGCAEVDERFQTILSTVTHRAPEVFVATLAGGGGGGRGGVYWNEAADMWSLGCTLYELWHGVTLWSYVPDADVETFDQIQRWALSADGGHQTWPAGWPRVIPGSRGTLPAARFVSTGDADVDHVIRSCLRIVPSERITARAVLSQPLFAGVALVRYSFRSHVPHALTPEEKSLFLQTVSPYTLPKLAVNAVVLRAACGLLMRVPREVREAFPFPCLCRGAYRIAQRLTNLPGMPLAERDAEAERAICESLSFHLIEGRKSPTVVA